MACSADLGIVRIESNGSHLLQGFRAAHAISEAGAVLAVSERELPRYQWLQQYFPIRYEVVDTARTVNVAVDSRTPCVTIGSIERPLLFAHAVFDAYRASWIAERPTLFSFIGHATSDRRQWIERALMTSLLATIQSAHHSSSSIDVRFSEGGRKWPEKAWDVQYATTLGRTKFALCPDGCEPWTYRFFEAAAAGAVPIVQTYSSRYDGFVCYALEHHGTVYEWTEAAARHNAALARERLTAPHNELAENVFAMFRR